MFTLSATDVAIASALQADTLRIEKHVSRYGSEYFAISDDSGLIEVQLSQADVHKRIAGIVHA